MTTTTATTTKLIRSETVADGTMSFHFERPEGFEYVAGNNIDVTLRNPAETDEKGNKRTFSIASAPYENELMVASRMRDSAFKRILRQAKPGFEVDIEGPYGDFVLHANQKRPAVFVIGGIGITPVRAIIKQAVHDKAPQDLVLFYSNRSKEQAAFLDELTELSKQDGFTLYPTLTGNTLPSGWDKGSGYIDANMLKTQIDDFTLPVFYLAGPPEMVKALRKVLDEGGADPDSIRTEEFPGY